MPRLLLILAREAAVFSLLGVPLCQQLGFKTSNLNIWMATVVSPQITEQTQLSLWNAFDISHTLEITLAEFTEHYWWVDVVYLTVHVTIIYPNSFSGFACPSWLTCLATSFIAQCIMQISVVKTTFYLVTWCSQELSLWKSTLWVSLDMMTQTLGNVPVSPIHMEDDGQREVGGIKVFVQPICLLAKLVILGCFLWLSMFCKPSPFDEKFSVLCKLFNSQLN